MSCNGDVLVQCDQTKTVITTGAIQGNGGDVDNALYFDPSRLTPADLEAWVFALGAAADAIADLKVTLEVGGFMQYGAAPSAIEATDYILINRGGTRGTAGGDTGEYYAQPASDLVAMVATNADDLVSADARNALRVGSDGKLYLSTPHGKFDATTDPTADDDSANTAGNGEFGIGSLWLNTVTDEFFRCADASVGAAVWLLVGGSNIAIGEGLIEVGVDDTTPGVGRFFGGGNGEAGGRVELFQPADHDSTTTHTYLAADAEYFMIRNALAGGGEVDGFRLYASGNVQLARSTGFVEIGGNDDVAGLLVVQAGSGNGFGARFRLQQDAAEDTTNEYIELVADDGGLIFQRTDGADILQLKEDRGVAFRGYGAGVLITNSSGLILSAAESTAATYRANSDTGFLTNDQVWAAMAEVTLADWPTPIVWDMDTGIDFVITLAGNRTLGNPTNVQVGKKGRLRVVQDGSGNRTLSFGDAYEFAGGSAPTLSSGASDQDVLYYDCISAGRILISMVPDIY